MAGLRFSTLMGLCVVSCFLVYVSEVQCEVTSGSGGGYRRRLTQATSGSSRASFSGSSPTALRASSSSSGGTSAVTAVAGGCRERASGSGAVSAACVGTDSVTPASRTNDDDDADEEEEEESTIGLRNEDDRTYCTLCPTKNDCDVCCCFDGECVNRSAAERGTADCTEVKPARGKTAPSPLECERCREDDCDQYYHWCR